MNFVINNGYSEGFCLVKTVEKKTSTKGGPYLDLVFCDKSGEISAKLWDYSADKHGEYISGDIVKVRGLISQYNGTDQFKVDRIRKASSADEINPEDFVPVSEHDTGDMFGEISRICEQFSDRDLSKITLYILNANKEKLLFWPAAFKLHHAIRGGLLYHTLSIVRMAQALCKIYPFVDEELLVSGAMLHDIAKTTEFTMTDAGTASGYSLEGNLIGHLAKGAMMIEEAADKLQTPEELKLMLEHMVLSHHGEPEYGAAVRPQFIEAELLSELDMMDARIYEMAEAVFNTDVGEFSGKLWALDNRKMYNHGRMKSNQTTNIL